MGFTNRRRMGEGAIVNKKCKLYGGMGSIHVQKKEGKAIANGRGVPKRKLQQNKEYTKALL